jgi:putative tryptophan/tyrosine transport system substrate-binding protein
LDDPFSMTLLRSSLTASPMNRRQALGLLIGGLAARPLACRAQPPAKMNVILWVSTEAQPDPFIEGFRDGMKARGYVEGRDLSFILRYAPGSPAAVRAMLPELLTIPADLIVSSGPAMLAMKATTKRTVLFAMSGDPVDIGIVESLARPGRNFTGSTFMSLDICQKRVHLLQEMLPHMRTLAVLSNTGHPGEQSEHSATIGAAQRLGIRLAYVPFASADELESAPERVLISGADAMIVYPDGTTLVNRVRIAEFAKKHGLPSMFGWREYADAGGLASYGANQRATYRRLAAYADRLLNGESPALLPVEQPTAFELVINMQTARQLELEVPPSFLARADDLIE